MAYILQPWQVFLTTLAGWINRHQPAAIDFLREENRVLLEQLGGRRIRLTDDQRSRRGPSNVKSVLRNPDLVALQRRIERRACSWTMRPCSCTLFSLAQFTDHEERTFFVSAIAKCASG